MKTPRVTFIVPCYKLAHLLPECISSILEQTYTNLDVLIMDDCSPDHTAEVARSFQDPRVRYVRNDPNLGHLRNYNEGIARATGDYVWLISADDRLRRPYVVQRYVELMEARPQVGYAFCRGLSLRDGEEGEIVKWASVAESDSVFPGREFLARLTTANCVLAPSGMVRRQCYERLGVFPLDLPFAGDWYLWSLFALHYDVAYFAEPMVNYREHNLSMTDTLIADDIRLLSQDDLKVRWRMKRLIEEAGDQNLVRHCRSQIVEYYIGALSSRKWRGSTFRMNLHDFEESLALHSSDPAEREAIRKQVLAGVGVHLYWDETLAVDLELYRLAIRYGGFNPKLWLKYSILRLGPVGTLLMRAMSGLRSAAPGQVAKGA